MLRWLRRMEDADRAKRVALPGCVNDKFAWRKIFDLDPRFPILSDKIAQRGWTGAAAGGVPWVPVLWSGDDPAAIPAELFRRPVVIKAAHASGRMVFCGPDGADRETAVETMRAHLATPHGDKTYEWAYGRLPRRVVVEPVLGPSEQVRDIKVHTYGPRIERVGQISDRRGTTGSDIWKMRDGRLTLAPEPHDARMTNPGLPLPPVTGRAMAAAIALGGQFDHMRVDFITDGAELWLGELTVYSHGGFLGRGEGTDPEHPASAMWDLRRSWFMKTPQRGWREAYRRALGRVLEDEVTA